MNTSDLNARSALTKRQRRSHVPRVECLESRELLAYPFAGVNYLIHQAVVHHKNTALQTIAGVNASLDRDLASGPLASLTATFTSTGLIPVATANTFVAGVLSNVATYEQDAAAQLLPHFAYVNGQIFNHAQSILNGVIFHTNVYEGGFESATQYYESVYYLCTH